jgi:hypothetical protein
LERIFSDGGEQTAVRGVGLFGLAAPCLFRGACG